MNAEVSKSISERVGSRVMGGLILVGLGIVFLLKNYGADVDLPKNWWAGILLVIGFSSFAAAWQSSKANNSARFDRYLRTGIILTALGIVFLLNLDMGKIWPIFLIGAGVMVFFGRGRRRRFEA